MSAVFPQKTHRFIRYFAVGGGGGATLLLTGCFLFVTPDRPAEAIASATVHDRNCYRLRNDDSFCCMRIHLPDPAVRRPMPAVLIFPGGAYGVLAMDKEGNDFAEILGRHGIAGAVVKYPLGSIFGHFSRHPAMINAAQRAIRQIRYHAPELGIDPGKIGVMGFSAGGHLAGLTAVWPSEGDHGSADPVERVSARPDFVILCYPVVSMDAPCSHRTSRRNLLGWSPDEKDMRELSLEKRITPDCPPFFVWFTMKDRTVDPQNGLLLSEALERNRVPHRVRVYPDGPHGMGLPSASDMRKYPEASRWPEEMLDFLRERNFLDPTMEAKR